jgi:hypothetical protein
MEDATKGWIAAETALISQLKTAPTEKDARISELEHTGQAIRQSYIPRLTPDKNDFSIKV